MSNRTYSQDELSAVLKGFGITDQTDVSRYGSGHINDTFKVETKRGVRYILQRVTDAFDKDILKSNIIRVTNHLKSKGVKTLDVLGYENPWRLYAFLEGYTSVDVITDPAQAELDFVNRRREEAAKIVTMMAKGEIPERITHNDTKINNVMLAPDGTNVVIDLDTTMPGSALYDFGDMVRTSSAAAAEDEKDLSKVYSKKEYFEALVKGYLAPAKFLTEAEKANLAFSGRLITLTIGIRFLTDYLAGDTYFHTAYEGHNLVRCHTQFKMVESMEAQASEYEAIVRKYA